VLVSLKKVDSEVGGWRSHCISSWQKVSLFALSRSLIRATVVRLGKMMSKVNLSFKETSIDSSQREEQVERSKVHQALMIQVQSKMAVCHLVVIRPEDKQQARRRMQTKMTE
jgi:hypothetical protein